MKKRFGAIFGLVLVLGAVMLAGCMVGPDYSRPETVAQTDSGFFHAGNHDQDVNNLDRLDRWWRRFGDTTTAVLVERAIENNNDLKAAAARVLQARAAFRENAGRRLPDVSYNMSRDRSKRSFNFGGGGRFSVMTTTWTHTVSASYILDLFGKLRRLERAAWADMLAAEANEQALTNSMIASVIKARIDIATTQRLLAIARANTKSRQSTLEIVERRYEQGLVGPVDVRLARENLAASKGAEPLIELSLITAHHALDVLLARRPGSSEQLPETLSALPDLEPITVGMPASLLDRRPDVRAAELGLRASNERIGVSIAQLYPDLTLTGNWGRSADGWRDIWKDETEIYTAVFALAQPLFKGGQLRAQVDGAKARYSEAAAVYAGTVLTALKEVEDALISEQILQRRLAEVQSRLTEAIAAEDLSRERYQRGVETILTVLESERRRRIAENELAVLKGRIWTTRVNIHLALGGDWASEERDKERQG
jgi:multidrug efflux system outer membrane protein